MGTVVHGNIISRCNGARRVDQSTTDIIDMVTSDWWHVVKGSGTIKISLEFVVGSGFLLSHINTGFHVDQIFW